MTLLRVCVVSLQPLQSKTLTVLMISQDLSHPAQNLSIAVLSAAHIGCTVWPESHKHEPHSSLVFLHTSPEIMGEYCPASHLGSIYRMKKLNGRWSKDPVSAFHGGMVSGKSCGRSGKKSDELATQSLSGSFWLVANALIP